MFVVDPSAPIKMVSSGMQITSKVGLSAGPMTEMGVEYDQFPAPPFGKTMDKCSAFQRAFRGWILKVRI